jgi:long-chain acyl-CoA synthetase
MNPTQLPLQSFYHWEKAIPNQTFLRQPLNGQWMEYSYQKTGDEIRRMAAGLKALNLPPQSKIALLSKNCAHWIMADLAIMMAGHTCVPLYPTITAATINQILVHSESVAIFVGKLDDYPNQKSGIPDSLTKISFPFYGLSDGLLWNDLLAQHAPIAENVYRDANDLFTIAYTSGTTGMPKGVMMTHYHFGYGISMALDNLKGSVGLPDHPRLFSYLPLSHVAERMIIEMLGIYTGGTISFAETLESFGKNLADTQPNLFFGVPRIWAKFQEKVLEKMPQKKMDTMLKIPILNSIVKKKIQKALGLDKASVCVSAAAPLPVDIIHWFGKLGIVVREIYGMTEGNGISNGNYKKIKIGTVGHPYAGSQVRISADGEVQTKHEAMMLGYYKEPELTKEMFTEDGFLKTGDQGSVDSEGFLTITGRIKDLFKTDKGKYVAPAPIEMKLLANPDIEQVCVVGMGIPQPIALTVLSATGQAKSNADIAKSLAQSLEEINPQLEHHEHLKKAVIMKTPWTIENNLMTPTLKVKRNEVEKIHLPKYPMWYQKEGVVVWE